MGETQPNRPPRTAVPKVKLGREGVKPDVILSNGTRDRPRRSGGMHPYEIYADPFDGTFAAPIRIRAPSDAEAVRLAMLSATGNAVLEVYQQGRLVCRLQPEQIVLPSALAA